MTKKLFFATYLSNAEANDNREQLIHNGKKWLCGRCTVGIDAVDDGYKWTKIPRYTYTGLIAHFKM